MTSIVIAFLLRHPDALVVLGWGVFSTFVDALPPLPPDAPWAIRWLVASMHGLAGNGLRCLSLVWPGAARWLAALSSPPDAPLPPR